MLKDIPLNQITIGERHRKDLGDIAALAASIQEVGLLHPIVLTGDYTLIVGRRRLAAYAHLQRETIPALVVDLAKPLQAELDENDQRKDFTPSERVDIAEAILEQKHAAAKERQREAGKKHGRGKIASVNLSEAIETAAPSRDVAAAAVGWSGPTYAKAKAVVDAAKEDPDFQDVVDAMDRTGNVSRAYSQLPAYARTEDEDNTPKTSRRLRYETLLQRIEHLMADVVMEQAPLYTDEQYGNLCTLIQFYANRLTTLKEERHAASV